MGSAKKFRPGFAKPNLPRLIKHAQGPLPEAVPKAFLLPEFFGASAKPK